MSESKASLWLSLAVVFAGLVASWVTLREQTANHERHITELRSEVRDIQRDSSMTNRLRSVELNIEAMSQQIQFLRQEIQELKRDKRTR